MMMLLIIIEAVATSAAVNETKRLTTVCFPLGVFSLLIHIHDRYSLAEK